MKWFRFYSEFVDDPKIAMMSDCDQLLWVKALCLASDSKDRGSILLTDEEICWKLRITKETWLHAVDKFRVKGMIEHCDGGYKITNWSKRQFDSDSSAERVANLRQNRRTEGEKKARRNQVRRERYHEQKEALSSQIQSPEIVTPEEVQECNVTEALHVTTTKRPQTTDPETDPETEKIKYNPVPSEEEERASASGGGEVFTKGGGEVVRSSSGESMASSASATEGVKQGQESSVVKTKSKSSGERAEKTKKPTVFNYSAQFEAWWDQYRTFCQLVSSEGKMISSGKKTEAWVSWKNLFGDGEPSPEFMKGDEFYRQVKQAEFQKKGELSDVSHGCRYLGKIDDNPKWLQAYEFKTRKEAGANPAIQAEYCPLGPSAADRQLWNEFCATAKQFNLSVEILTSTNSFMLGGRSFQYNRVKDQLEGWQALLRGDSSSLNRFEVA